MKRKRKWTPAAEGRWSGWNEKLNRPLNFALYPKYVEQALSLQENADEPILDLPTIKVWRWKDGTFAAYIHESLIESPY